LKSLLELSSQSLLVLGGWVLDHLGVKVVEVDVSDVDREVVLLSDHLGCVTHTILEPGLSSTLEGGPHVRFLGSVLTSLEFSNWLRGNGEVTPLQNVRFVGLFLDKVVLGLKGLYAELIQINSLVSVLHPVNGEKITKAGADMLTIDLVIWVAVGTP